MDNKQSDSLPKLIVLGKTRPRYDLNNLPKRSRKSRSFSRRGAQVAQPISDEPAFRLTSDCFGGSTSSILSESYHHEETFCHNPVADCTESTSTLITSEIELLQTYKLEVMRAKAFTVLDTTYTSAAIQDFDTRISLLKASTFQLIQRYYKNFLNEECWVYCCSCDTRRQEFICSLSGEILQNHEEFETACQWPRCIHCNAASFFMEELDVLNNLEPVITLEEYTTGSGALSMDHSYACSGVVYDLQSSNSIVCVDAGNRNYGFVGRDQSRFKCFSCRYDTHNCSHTKYLQDQLDSDTGMLPEVVYNMISQNEGRPTKYHGPLVQSRQTIEFKVSIDIQNILKNGLLTLPEVQQCSESEDTKYHLIPNMQGNCDMCGESWDNEDPVEANWCHGTVVAISLNQTFDCKVFYRKCSDVNCCSKKSFDGKELGCLYIGKRLICYEVLRDYMHLFLHAGVTLHTFYKVWCDRHLDAGNTLFKKQIDYNSWRFAWYAYLKLLDVDYSSGWTCHVCGTQPDIIVCDGTSLAFQKSFVPWQSLNQTATHSDAAAWPLQ